MIGRSGRATVRSIEAQARIASRDRFSARWIVQKRYPPGARSRSAMAGAASARRIADLARDTSSQILHQVADELDAVGDAFAREVVDGCRRRGEQPVDRWSATTRLTSSGIRRSNDPQTRLDVSDRDVELGRHERPG